VLLSQLRKAEAGKTALLRKKVEQSSSGPFARRLLAVCLVSAAVTAVWMLSDVLVLAFASALLALFVPWVGTRG
jgi:hypothetical protein